MNGYYIAKINNLCNVNCIFCADSIKARQEQDFDYDTLIQDLEENRKNFDTMFITGGEPTIYKYIFEYIRHAKYKCKYKRVILNTNAFLLVHEDFLDKLIESGVDSFIISFSTSNERMHDAVTKVKGSFQHINKALSNIKKRNKEIVINTVLHKLNYKSISETVAYLISKNVDFIQLAFLNPADPSVMVNGKSAIAIKYDELMPYIKGAFETANKLNFDGLQIETFPICIAKEFVDKIADLKKPKENKGYYNMCKTKPEKCNKCTHFKICDGVWEAYLEQFGDQELNPILEQVGDLEINPI